jgi:hypothetical protein
LVKSFDYLRLKEADAFLKGQTLASSSAILVILINRQSKLVNQFYRREPQTNL